MRSQRENSASASDQFIIGHNFKKWNASNCEGSKWSANVWKRYFGPVCLQTKVESKILNFESISHQNMPTRETVASGYCQLCWQLDASGTVWQFESSTIPLGEPWRCFNTNLPTAIEPNSEKKRSAKHKVLSSFDTKCVYQRNSQLWIAN